MPYYFGKEGNMGISFNAICNQCGHKFMVSKGGGFVFHRLECDTCGNSKSMSFEEIGEPHLRYLKGLPGPYCIATREHDKDVKENYPGEPLSREEYHSMVENLAGKCSCGGSFKFDAPSRCPKCRSSNLREDPDDPGRICYD
jgi:hypothetical protein